MCIDRYIFLNVYFFFCIVAFYIYFIHKYIVSPVRLFMPNQYLADWLLHYLMSLPIGWDKVLSASMWSYFHSLNSCRGFFYFTSESRSSGVCCPTTNVAFLLAAHLAWALQSWWLNLLIKKLAGRSKLHRALLWYLGWGMGHVPKGLVWFFLS